jgi:hypothetical protein
MQGAQIRYEGGLLVEDPPLLLNRRVESAQVMALQRLHTVVMRLAVLVAEFTQPGEEQICGASHFDSPFLQPSLGRR